MVGFDSAYCGSSITSHGLPLPSQWQVTPSDLHEAVRTTFLKTEQGRSEPHCSAQVAVTLGPFPSSYPQIQSGK